jgi:hypothetical protein
MARSLHPVMRAILRGPYPWLVRSRSWPVPGGSGSAGDRAASPAGCWGAGWRAAASRTWSAVVASRAAMARTAMARTGSPARMSGCRSSGLMAPGSGPGQGMPAAQLNGGLPGDGLADACPGEQRAGLPVQLPGHGERELGVVLAAALGQLQRLGQVAGVGAGEQLDQAEPGELLLHRGGGRAGVVEVAPLRPGGGAGEEVALAAPGVGVEPGLGEAAQPPPGVVDR